MTKSNLGSSCLRGEPDWAWMDNPAEYDEEDVVETDIAGNPTGESDELS